MRDTKHHHHHSVHSLGSPQFFFFFLWGDKIQINGKLQFDRISGVTPKKAVEWLSTPDSDQLTVCLYVEWTNPFIILRKYT